MKTVPVGALSSKAVPSSKEAPVKAVLAPFCPSASATPIKLGAFDACEEEEAIATLSPYWAHHVNRFGVYDFNLDRCPSTINFEAPILSTATS